MQELILSSEMLPFDLSLSLTCGQIFCWEYKDGFWTGIHTHKPVKIKQNQKIISYEGLDEQELIRFLALDHRIEEIISDIRSSIFSYSGEIDFFFEEALQMGKGLRILRQEPWECLISFICSANSNIPTIGKRISLLSKKFGDNCDLFYSFPDVSLLASADEYEIRACSAGYRAPFIKQTAELLKSQPDLLERIDMLPYQEGKKILMSLPGVGPKVADCVLLFAYGRYEAVPVDVWIRGILEKKYHQYLSVPDGRKNTYDNMANFCRSYFGRYAGYAQQFLFTAREHLQVY